MKRAKPFVLPRAPAWATELAGAPLERVVAWRSGTSYVVRASTAEQTIFWELHRGAGVSCHRIEPRRKPALRTPEVPSAAAREELARFVDRLEWVESEGTSDRYAPTPREARALALERALRAIRTPEDAAAVELAPETDETATAVGRFLDVVAGRWERVFPRLDAGARSPSGHAWLEALEIGLAGDVDEMRRHASALAPDPSGFCIVEAAAIELAGLEDAAIERYRGVEGLVAERQADLCLHVAKLSRARGRIDEAVEQLRRALLVRDDDARHVVRATEEQVRCGAFDDAHAALEAFCARSPETKETAIALAELLLWADRPAEAGRWLDRFVVGSEELRILRAHGVRLALEGRREEARGVLERARQLDPDDMETLLWLAELSLGLGDLEVARAHLTRSRARIQTRVHTLLMGAFADELRPGPYLDRLHRLLDVLGESVARWQADPRSSALRVLSRFGGNRGEWLTLKVPGRAGLGIERLELSPDDALLGDRDASADLIRAIGSVPLTELVQRFDALADTLPRSPHPLCYGGELDLWLGNYARAITRFDAALGRAKARWGYVGRAAAEILRAEWDAADATLARMGAEFAPVRGATTHVYLGEMWRVRGEHERAIRQLEEAVSAKPGRVGAWMNLALAHRALGHTAEAEQIFERLEAHVPRLLWDAWRALGEAPRWPLPRERLDEIFLRALAMMRGNRSSHTITYFGEDGSMRVARPMEAWRGVMASHATTVAFALRNRLAAGDEA